ncbi:hypothetical protein JTB14_016494 [Gonioctena quinquepunctata]|nr:hypothetical protein JTB14_016494 [Gonioctena quinquepunctata]
MGTHVPNVEVDNKFQALEELDEKVQEQHQDSPIIVKNRIEAPPIIIKEKRHWPNISTTLKNLGIKSEKNFNTKDGLKMILQNMEMYDKCTNTSDQHTVQYFTFNKPQNREIRAIFEGNAEDIEPAEITK